MSKPKQLPVAPADWLNDLSYVGVARNSAALCYSVRFSVWGKQLFVGNADSQKDAAKLYDMALWKFLPKLARMKPMNFPDDFAFITQRLIDETAPRLNELYVEFPFLTPEDAKRDEDELRESRLNGPVAKSGERSSPSRNLAAYNREIFRLQKLRLSLEGEVSRHELYRPSLPLLHKLAEADRLFSEVLASLRLTADTIARLEDSMSSQRAYYQKIACSDEQLERASRALPDNQGGGSFKSTPAVPIVFDGGASARPVRFPKG